MTSTFLWIYVTGVSIKVLFTVKRHSLAYGYSYLTFVAFQCLVQIVPKVGEKKTLSN